MCGNLILPMAIDYVYFYSIEFAKLIIRYRPPVCRISFPLSATRNAGSVPSSMMRLSDAFVSFPLFSSAFLLFSREAFSEEDSSVMTEEELLSAAWSASDVSWDESSDGESSL
ncbi:hypothetical protein [Bilifractor sp. HCP3S3_D3]|uniref:hypothetical protein n=1 Tax=Bilifractor sp. HCP3S3_D3 TaxID=3438907 RepID=UPI003F8C49A3